MLENFTYIKLFPAYLALSHFFPHLILVFSFYSQPLPWSSDHFQNALRLTPSHKKKALIFSSSSLYPIALHTIINYKIHSIWRWCKSSYTLCYVLVLHLCIYIAHLFVIKRQVYCNLFLLSKYEDAQHFDNNFAGHNLLCDCLICHPIKRGAGLVFFVTQLCQHSWSPWFILFKYVTLQGLWVYNNSAITYHVFSFRESHHCRLDVTPLINNLVKDLFWTYIVHRGVSALAIFKSSLFFTFGLAGYSEKMPTDVSLSTWACRECECPIGLKGHSIKQT